MEKLRKKKNSVKASASYTKNQDNIKPDTINKNSTSKKHSKQKKYKDFERGINLNNYPNFNPKLDKNIIITKKTSSNIARLKRSLLKVTSNKKQISINWRYNKELENIGKIDPSTKSFTPALNNRFLHPTDNQQKKEKILKKKYEYKIPRKKIKINMVSQKFKIANDYDEINSNIFLKEKDECLKSFKLTDKIEEDEGELSPISFVYQKINFTANKRYRNCNSCDFTNNLSDSEKYLSQLLMGVN